MGFLAPVAAFIGAHAVAIGSIAAGAASVATAAKALTAKPPSADPASIAAEQSAAQSAQTSSDALKQIAQNAPQAPSLKPVNSVQNKSLAALSPAFALGGTSSILGGAPSPDNNRKTLLGS